MEKDPGFPWVFEYSSDCQGLFKVSFISGALNVSNADICSSHHFGSSTVHGRGAALTSRPACLSRRGHIWSDRPRYKQTQKEHIEQLIYFPILTYTDTHTHTLAPSVRCVLVCVFINTQYPHCSTPRLW